MEFPSDLKYHKEHTWVKIEDDIATIGITDHAQNALGEILFVDLPEVGETITQGETFGTVESAKVASDLYAPISGEIIEVNEELDDDPELVNNSPYEDGWMIKVKIKNPDEQNNLLSSSDYEKSLE
ncbi:MAG: glycine cleavage system protein GcvH [Tepidanaerobacter acetatoxydans]|uniref:Glycine cleavage system H protein n=1 Tax=Tepidanaerobacter acetatoxydans (strain DSM 21804 / JCM 16047 / Re1) TaxID=1209989 RepID=F4LVQ3_TEPAE|nr:glycine cleavage system protein GcvH [Tepidanaerobacter acetatoxydans]AEE90750.1 Glycine cleavage system H protein [Tepidanaerobacter acetatoxydans Re1]NLU11333.1 glycine cleavage system protein GcvH [Tepidanaerobacter acetatoxydans]CCP25303.1 glycine cleavage complex lipoylprotein [Tepidanaerobacter acetatoxydans Re1]